MQRFSLSLLLGCLILFAGFTGASAQTDNLASTSNIFMFPNPVQISDLALKTSTGQNATLKDFRGKVVLLHFWSIQCPACRVEEPLLQRLKQNLGSSGLEILGVNLVDPPQAILQHTMANRPPFPVLYDGGAGFSLRTVRLAGRNTAFLINPSKEAILEVPGFPTTYIVDCKGNAVGYSVGVAGWETPPAVALLRGLLADGKSCKVSKAVIPQPIR